LPPLDGTHGTPRILPEGLNGRCLPVSIGLHVDECINRKTEFIVKSFFQATNRMRQDRGDRLVCCWLIQRQSRTPWTRTPPLDQPRTENATRQTRMIARRMFGYVGFG
jgi:hypothetical protein